MTNQIKKTATVMVMIAMLVGLMDVGIANAQADFLFEFGSFNSRGGLFDNPRGLTVDDSGRIIIADSDHHSVKVFNSSGEFLFTFGSFGYWRWAV